MSKETEDIFKELGILEERTKKLDELPDETEVDPKEVGNWITIIGRALLAIFRP